MIERQRYIDYMKGIGIVLVVLGHVNYANYPIKEWVYSFHMPLFYFISGLNLKRDSLGITEFISKKIYNIIVPFILWGLIYAPFGFKNVLLILYGSYYSLINAGSLSALWFLPSLFIGMIISKIAVQKCQKAWEFPLLSIGLYCLSVLLPSFDKGYPLGFDIGPMAASFILIGYWLRELVVKTKKATRFIMLMIGLVGSIIAVCNIHPGGGMR